MENRGEIQLIVGPMFSGKTTELLRRLRRYTIADRSCLLLKYHGDQRYTSASEVTTHDRGSAPAQICKNLCDVEKLALAHEIIGIDEGQFFPDIASWADKLANGGRTVIVAALDGTYQRKPFQSISDLLPLVETVSKLCAICSVCKMDASFTKRTSDETEVEVIGGSDKYAASCRRCFSGQAC